MPVSLTIDGQKRTLAVAEDMPLLWALRDKAGVTAVKFGCGAGLCGACSVLVDGQRLFACQTAIGDVAGKSVTTVEGLTGQPLGQALAAALLKANPKPDDAAIDEGMSGNICRCGTYNRIRAAIHRAAETIKA